MGMVKRMRSLKKAAKESINSAHHNDMLNRSTSLAIQTCALNGFSLIITAISMIILGICGLLNLGHFSAAEAIVFDIWQAYFAGLQYAVVICSSNVGVIVHCYYSKLYREAARSTFSSMINRVKQWFYQLLPAAVQNTTMNAVHPEMPENV